MILARYWMLVEGLNEFGKFYSNLYSFGKEYWSINCFVRNIDLLSFMMNTIISASVFPIL
jgi:hypothetical protein